MSLVLPYESLIQEINEDIEAGVIKATDYIQVVRKRKAKSENYCPIIDYYYVNSHPQVKVEEMRVCDVLQELVLRNMMR